MYRSGVNRRYFRSGACAGAISALVFTVIHDLFISDIWFSLVLMLVAGAICGLCVAWSYTLLIDRPSVASWLVYNLLYVIILALLGVTSLLAFEPATTMAALLAANGPPHALIAQAMPLTAVFTLVSAILIALLYGASRLRFAAVLLTCIVITLLLGLNVSAIGLVLIPSTSLYLVGEMFALILVLNLVYVALLIVLERKSLLDNRCVALTRADSST